KQVVYAAVEVHRVDLLGTNERIDRQRLLALRSEEIELLLFKLYVLSFRILEALDDLSVGNLTVRGADFGIVNPLMIWRVKQVEMNFGVFLDLGIDGLNFEGHQPE